MKVSDMEENDEDVLIHGFKPVFLLLKLSGFYLGRETNTIKRIALISYSILFKIAILYNALRYSSIFQNVKDFDGKLTSSLAAFTFYCYATYISLALTIALPAHLYTVLDMMKTYISEFGTMQYLRSIRKRMGLFVFLFTVLCLIIIIGSTVMSTHFYPNLKRHMTPLDKPGALGVFYYALYIILQIMVSSNMMSAFVVFNCLSVIIYRELTIANKKLQDFDGETDIHFEKAFDNFCQRHGNLCDIVSRSNDIVTHMVSSSYGFGIPIICFLCFGLIKGSLPVDELMMCSGNLSATIAIMVVITLGACAINDKAHESIQVIYRQKWTSFSEKSLHKMSMFMARLSSEKIGYSVYGMFVVDRSTVLMIIGTVVTYAVVVLQLQTESSQGCASVCSSLSNLTLNRDF